MSTRCYFGLGFSHRNPLGLMAVTWMPTEFMIWQCSRHFMVCTYSSQNSYLLRINNAEYSLSLWQIFSLLGIKNKSFSRIRLNNIRERMQKRNQKCKLTLSSYPNKREDQAQKKPRQKRYCYFRYCATMWNIMYCPGSVDQQAVYAL